MIFTADMLWVFPQKCPGREIWQSDPLQGVLILFPFRWKQPVTSNQTHLCIFKSEEHQNQDTEKKTWDWHLPRHLSTFGTKSILWTLKVQKCVSWRYQHTLRKTVKGMFTTGSNTFGEKKCFFFCLSKQHLASVTLRNLVDRCLLFAVFHHFGNALYFFMAPIKSEYLPQNASDSVLNFSSIIFIIFNIFYLQKPADRLKFVIRLITD